MPKSEAKPRHSADDGADTPRLEPQVMIETRGEGGYVVAPGSPANVHQKVTAYKIVHGSLSGLSPLTAQESERVLALCRSYTRFTPQNVQRKPGEKYSGVPRPGDIFNENADLQQLLLDHGWTIERTGASFVRHGDTGIVVDRLPPGASCVECDADAVALDEFIDAIEQAQTLDRSLVREVAAGQFATNAIVDRLVEAIGSISTHCHQA